MHPLLLIVLCLPLCHSLEEGEGEQADSCRLFTMMCLLAGDVLQLPVPVPCADLLPDSGSAPEGLRGWDSTHVHTQGNARLGPAFPRTPEVQLGACWEAKEATRENVLAGGGISSLLVFN